MKPAKCALALLTFLLIGSVYVQGQVYLGMGYAEAMLSSSAIDDTRGVAITVQKPFEFQNRPKWSFDPSLKVAILNSRASQDFNPSMSTTLGLSPLFSYKLVNLSWMDIKPFGGPYVLWLNWLKGDVDLPTRSSYSGELLYGIEVGLNVDFRINEKFFVRLTPFSYQWNEDHFRQGFITVAVAL